MALATHSEINTAANRFGEKGYCVFRHVLTESESAEARRVLDQDIAALNG